MNRIKRRIILGALLFGGTAAVIAGGSVISEKGSTVPAFADDLTEELPVIILDAGHGESS